MSMQQAAVPSDPSDIPETAPVSPSSSSPQSEREQRVILHGVSWATYESLLADFQDSHAAHFAYDRGELEIMVLSFNHETINRTLASLVEALADGMGIDFINAGSTTFKREELLKGFEPDTCFYMQHAAHVRGKKQIDLTEDPPPDLAIEVDLTNPSLNKLPIYAAIGVPELWRYDSQALTIFRLESGEYREQKESTALPGLNGLDIVRFIEESQELTRPVWLRRVHEWTHQQEKRD
jgi:Uma2 family endonuclease